ncbi:hypothetical protein LTR17_002728 [Elasticomyces elasticus]|nr:hypothetical protein LTR17_002728 [Elasticomyces elasticus]
MEEPPPPPYSAQPQPSQFEMPTAMQETIKNVLKAEGIHNGRFLLDRQRYLRQLLMDLLMIDYGIRKPHHVKWDAAVGALHIAGQLHALGYESNSENNAIFRLVQHNVAFPAIQLNLPFDIVLTMLVRYSENLSFGGEYRVTYTGCLAAVYAKHGERGMLEKCQRDLNEVVDVVVPSGQHRDRLRSRIEAIIAHRSAWEHLQWKDVADGSFLQPPRQGTTNEVMPRNYEQQTTLDCGATHPQIETTNTPQLLAPQQSRLTNQQDTNVLIRRYRYTRIEYRRKAAAMRHHLGTEDTRGNVKIVVAVRNHSSAVQANIAVTQSTNTSQADTLNPSESGRHQPRLWRRPSSRSTKRFARAAMRSNALDRTRSWLSLHAR